MNKKGEPTFLTWLVAIIVVAVVLVFILYNLGIISKEWFKIGGSNKNVDAIEVTCNTACDTKLKNAWCGDREVYFTDEQKEPEIWSCDNLKKQGKILLRPCDLTCPQTGTPEETPETLEE